MLANGSQDETIKLWERRIVRQKRRAAPERLRQQPLWPCQTCWPCRRNHESSRHRAFSITSIGGSTPV